MNSLVQNDTKNQLPAELKNAIKELRLFKHLRDSGIKRNFGFTCSYLFEIVFSLAFLQFNWFNVKFNNIKSENYPGKDAVYRFINYPSFAWRKFLTRLSCDAIKRVSALTSENRVNVLIIDDSTFKRDRSKKVELLARLWDHVFNRYYKGFKMLTLGWSDGNTFLPCDFALLSSNNSRVNGVDEKIDKRCHGYKRRTEALTPAPDVIPSMIDNALASGVDATFVLMDSWFTYPPLIRQIINRGLDVIGMMKDSKQTYLVNGQKLDLQGLYYSARKVESSCPNILKVIIANLAPDIKIKVVFVRHRTKKREWLAILSTDITLSEQEIIRIYRMRWEIETFFKFTKSLLKLQKEFQGRSYDMLISHTTIVFARYIVIAWLDRKNSDDRTVGGLFSLMCSEMECMDWVEALCQLLSILEEVAKTASKKTAKIIKMQLLQWFGNLPLYIRALLPVCCCES